MARTTDNLLKMFADGAEASVRYRAFAEAADREGHPGAAKIFRAVAAAKAVLAASHFRAANRVDRTAANLAQALEDETYDYRTGYPPLIQDAVADDAIDARHSFEYALTVGPILVRTIGKALGSPELEESGAYYVCPVCGNLEFGAAPAKCPICGVDGSLFVEVW